MFFDRASTHGVLVAPHASDASGNIGSHKGTLLEEQQLSRCHPYMLQLYLNLLSVLEIYSLNMNP